MASQTLFEGLSNYTSTFNIIRFPKHFLFFPNPYIGVPGYKVFTRQGGSGKGNLLLKSEEILREKLKNICPCHKHFSVYRFKQKRRFTLISSKI